MNERIKQLAEQSWVDNFGPEGFMDPEKFAELIVLECVATIANDTANYPGEGMMAYYQGVQDSVRAIKKHFGLDGMSTEDKKTLIKELLGVKND
jgi:hypothetical protein